MFLGSNVPTNAIHSPIAPRPHLATWMMAIVWLVSLAILERSVIKNAKAPRTQHETALRHHSQHVVRTKVTALDAILDGGVHRANKLALVTAPHHHFQHVGKTREIALHATPDGGAHPAITRARAIVPPRHFQHVGKTREIALHATPDGGAHPAITNVRAIVPPLHFQPVIKTREIALHATPDGGVCRVTSLASALETRLATKTPGNALELKRKVKKKKKKSRANFFF